MMQFAISDWFKWMVILNICFGIWKQIDRVSLYFWDCFAEGWLCFVTFDMDALRALLVEPQSLCGATCGLLVAWAMVASALSVGVIWGMRKIQVGA